MIILIELYKKKIEIFYEAIGLWVCAPPHMLYFLLENTSFCFFTSKTNAVHQSVAITTSNSFSLFEH
jgi:hypothetical protein